MNWLRANYNWFMPVFTTILGIFIGKLWDQFLRKNEQKNEIKKGILAENARLRYEVDQIKRVETLRSKYSYCSKGYYFLQKGSEERKICSRCLDSEGKEVNLIITKDDYFRCPYCNNSGCIRDNPYDDNSEAQEAQIKEFLRYGN